MTLDQILHQAILCANLFLPLPIDNSYPTVELRSMTELDQQLFGRPDSGKLHGVYLPFENGDIIADSWEALVHETCHWIQHQNGYNAAGIEEEQHCSLIGQIVYNYNHMYYSSPMKDRCTKPEEFDDFMKEE